MKKIFIGFVGQSDELTEKILEIQEGYEIWNLKLFSLEEFTKIVKDRIPPVNNNVINNYIVEEYNENYGITEEYFSRCTWGLFIPDSLGDVSGDSFSETMFLLNLFSPSFLYPIFYVTDFGVTVKRYDNRKILSFGNSQGQAKLFTSSNFVDFFKTLLPSSAYSGTWQLDRVQVWKKEDWRLFVAGMLFSDLRVYDNSKSALTWQRESVEMSMVLESLFIADDTNSEEIGYRLRKRIAVLLSVYFPNIENDIKELYKARSEFVHGSFYLKLAKSSDQLPTPNFNLLHQQTEFVRWSLIGCLHLFQVINNGSKYPQKSVMSVLEAAIVDVKLRESILNDVSEVFSLLPTI